MAGLSYGNTGYTDIMSQDPTGLAMGAPTVDTGAAISNLNAPTQTGITAPSPVSGAPAPQVPGAPVPGGGAAAPSGPGFFSQYGPAQFALGAIQTLGSLWNSYQQNKIAKESIAFQKEAYQTNLANQEQSYNTELEDRINARYATEGRTNAAADAASYVEKNKL